MLSIIQTVTKVPTAEVVRDFLKSYIADRRVLIQAMAAKLQTGSYWGKVEDLERLSVRDQERLETEVAMYSDAYREAHPEATDAGHVVSEDTTPRMSDE